MKINAATASKPAVSLSTAIGAQIIRSTGGHLAVRMNAMISKPQEAEIRALLNFHWSQIEPQLIQEISEILGAEIKRG